MKIDKIIYDIIQREMQRCDSLKIPHSDFLTKISVLCFQNLAENE